MEIGASLGSIIKKYRIEKELTQEQLAEKLGIGRRHMGGLENEGKLPGYEVLYRLIHVLDIPADFIFRPNAVAHTEKQAQFINEFLSCDEDEQRIVMKTARTLIGELREKAGDD